MILDSVLASKRVDAGLNPHIEEQVDVTKSGRTSQETSSPEGNKKRQVRVAQISFEDYHSLWSGIATTRPVHNARNPLNDILRTDSKLQAAHFGMEQQELQEEIQKQLSEHNSLMYGKFEGQRAKQDVEDMKASRINMLKQIYLPKQDPLPLSAGPSISASMFKDIEPSEHEVEELLNWSSNLDKDEIYT
ncbi:hypothetical protein QZH41_018827 [Actinostola sp. cb2023]|nr:hypothetical protein QZH41_018827 [Actinostola sp. cb2023]